MQADSPSNPRPIVGLALGGGVARGAAHVGVLAALERAGIPIDVVAGASAGALIGAAVCAGWDAARLMGLAIRMRWWHIASLTFSPRGFLSFAKLERWLAQFSDAHNFDQLHLPFIVAATDLETGEAVWLRQGNVARAVRASCSVPGFVVPIEWDGRILGDGNFSDSLPVAAARSLGAEYVIGVDIFRPKLRRWLGPLGYGLAGLESAIRATGGGTTQADCLISPCLSGKTYLRFGKAVEMIKLGERAAEEKIPAIRRALGIQ